MEVWGVLKQEGINAGPECLLSFWDQANENSEVSCLELICSGKGFAGWQEEATEKLQNRSWGTYVWCRTSLPAQKSLSPSTSLALQLYWYWATL